MVFDIFQKDFCLSSPEKAFLSRKTIIFKNFFAEKVPMASRFFEKNEKFLKKYEKNACIAER